MTIHKIPAEWIERIFKRFDEIWPDRFVGSFGSETAFNLELVRWQSGLIGCTPDEIKSVLDMCRNGFIKDAPNVIEFFHYCKGNKKPSFIKPKQEVSSNPEIGKAYLQIIRDKLHGRFTSDGEATLSALNQQVLENKSTPEISIEAPNIKPFDGEIRPHWQDD